jgi:hypothetical protein
MAKDSPAVQDEISDTLAQVLTSGQKVDLFDKRLPKVQEMQFYWNV